jgi:hypothetical protein
MDSQKISLVISPDESGFLGHNSSLYFTHLNLAARKGDDFPKINPGISRAWGPRENRLRSFSEIDPDRSSDHHTIPVVVGL